MSNCNNQFGDSVATVDDFLKECVRYEERGFVEAHDMHDACLKWCRTNGRTFVDAPMFWSLMAEKEHPIRPSAAGRSGYVYVQLEGVN